MRRLILMLFLLVAGCGTTTSAQSSSDSPDSAAGSFDASKTPTVTSSGPAPRARGTEIIVADSEYGSMLYDASGQPIYLFDAEPSSRPTCYGACADEWPPVLTAGEPRAKEPARSDLLGTALRTDGTNQVTYAGHPLYFYAHEGKYQVLCHNVEEFGGTWLVVRPDGSPALG
jgi:predicted lipoprotein with Yx(FWY)xxD motif